MKYCGRLLSAIIVLMVYSGCKKFAEAPLPVTSLSGSAVYSTNSTAAAAVSGIYSTMTTNSVGGGTYGISGLLGLSADEFQLYSGSTDPLLTLAYANALVSNGTTPPPQWNDLYNCIYQANAAIAGISTASGVADSIKQQLVGEAEFVRAFCYFYLVNIYGDVPLTTTPNYVANEDLARSPEEAVYQQIVVDLKNAQSQLGSSFRTPSGATTTERVRPNSGAASAMLARVYLYEQKWDSAAAAATLVINNSQYRLVQNLDSAFLANNEEAIWQLEMPNNGFNAPDGSFLVGLIYYHSPEPNSPYLLGDSLIASFEPGDLRRKNWVDSANNGGITYYFPYKYTLYYTGKPPTQYPTLLRLAEQYLIRAEAEAQLGQLSAAITDLNIIRARAGLAGTSATSQSDVLNAILHERRVELFTEYGHRWFDLIRTGNINSVMTIMTPEKGGTWQTTDQLYPLSISEIEADPKLAQNPGYN